MTESMIVFARHNQPIIVMGGGMMGATAPLKLSGLLCIQNAVVLAGITLAQLVNPGCPVIYGVGGSPMDMHTGAYYIGGPELSRAIRIGVAMAKHYNLPCRGGGALTDSHQMDFQAGAQSAFSIGQSLAGHLDFIVHSCGVLSSYMAMSYEKFIADEDLWRHALYLEKPLDLTDLDQEVEAIKEVGVGGQFMTQERTVKFCRTELFRSPLMNRLPYEKWETVRNRTIVEKASSLVRERLECYQKPPIEKGIMKDLSDYVRVRKEEINRSGQMA
jgi:trimethylamine--corrinoid protein Co-methyltransferase